MCISIPENSKVHTTSGDKLPREVKVGDWVYSYDLNKNGTSVACITQANFLKELTNIYAIKLTDSKTIYTTESTKLLLTNRKEKYVKNATQGDSIIPFESASLFYYNYIFNCKRSMIWDYKLIYNCKNESSEDYGFIIKDPNQPIHPDNIEPIKTGSELKDFPAREIRRVIRDVGFSHRKFVYSFRVDGFGIMAVDNIMLKQDEER